MSNPDAVKLAKAVLEALETVCAWCDPEAAKGPGVSHGICPRHFKEQMRAIGLSDEEINARLQQKIDQGVPMPKDLGKDAEIPDQNAMAMREELLQEIAYFGPNGGDEPEEEPEGEIKMVQLSDILTEEQMKKVLELWNGSDSPDQALNRLRGYLQTIGDELAEKGVLPDYLAYVLYAKFTGTI